VKPVRKGRHVDVGIFGNTGSGRARCSVRFRAPAEAERPGKSAAVVRDQGPGRARRPDGEIFRPKKVTYISIAFHDIDAGETDPSPAGLDRASKRRGPRAGRPGLRRRLPPGASGGLDPAAEFRELSSAIVLSDYLVAQKRIERMTKEAKRTRSGPPCTRRSRRSSGRSPSERRPVRRGGTGSRGSGS